MEDVQKNSREKKMVYAYYNKNPLVSQTGKQLADILKHQDH